MYGLSKIWCPVFQKINTYSDIESMEAKNNNKNLQTSNSWN